MGKNTTKTPKRVQKENTKKIKRKVCTFCARSVIYIDFKDTDLLRKYMSERGKIRARRVSGNCTQHQSAIAIAIKTARELALLPYTQRTVTERTSRSSRPQAAAKAEDGLYSDDFVADVEDDELEIDELELDEKE